MRHILTFLLVCATAFGAVAQAPNGYATANFLAADVCGNDVNSQYFTMVVTSAVNYSLPLSPPQVVATCPATGYTKTITSYTGNASLVALLNTKVGACSNPVFFDLIGNFNGVASPGSRLMLFASQNPDIAVLPADAFADLCGGGRVFVAFGDYNGTTPIFPNNNPYIPGCGAYTDIKVTVNGVTQLIEYNPQHLAPVDGGYVGINNNNFVRIGQANNCSCPGLSCGTTPNINITGDVHLCAGERTTLTADAGAGYQYLWSTGATGASIEVGPYLTTEYEVLVFPPTAPQCAAVGKVTVNVFNPPDIEVTTMGENGGPACYGEKLYLRTVGGQPIQTPFTYTWTPPNPSIVLDPNEPAIILNEQTAGLYTITFQFNNGCTASKTIEATYPVQVPLRICSNAPVCTGEAVNLEISTPGVQYEWTGPNGFTGTGKTLTINNPVAGQYMATVRDENGCTLKGTTQVIVNECTPVVLTATATSTNTSCGLGNGTATATAISGTPPFSYNWSGTPSTNDPAVITGLSFGTYTVTITDAEGATATATATVQGSSAPNPVLVGTNTSCGNFNGAIQANVNYGTQPYSFNWADLNVTNEPQHRSELAAGTYALTVTDAVGCTNTAEVTIAPSMGANATAVVTQITCAGANNGAIQVTVGGGSSPYTYNWADLSTAPEPEDRTNLAPGTYALTVTANNGCTTTIAATINVPTPLSLTATATNATCGNNSGSIVLVAGGGTGVYLFDWSDLPGTNDPQNRTGLSAGTYTVTLTDANQCTATQSRTIQQTGIPSATATLTQITCFGNNTGAINLTVNGGVTPYLFNWADITTTPEPEDRSNLAAGTYAVTITDASSCTWSQSFTLTQPAAALAVTATATNATCGSNNGSINLTVNGGTGTYTFNWADITTQPEPQNRTGLTAGTYTATVTDANGCTTSTSATIDFNGLPSIAATTTNATCGNPVGGINLTISGGGSPYTFNWADITTGPEPEDRTGLLAGTYSVTVTGSTGCTSTGSWTLTNQGQLTLNADVVNTTCGLSNGSITVYATGGGPYNFDWAHIPGTSNSNALTNLAPSSPHYTVTVSNATCSTTVNYTILGSQAVVINSNITPTTCGLSNGVISVSATGIPGATYIYDWLHIPGSNNSATVGGLSSATNYQLTVVAINGCSQTQTFSVPSSIPAVTVTSVVTNARCGIANGRIDLTVSGGTSWTYDWAHVPGTSNSKNATNLAAGTYTVTVTSNHGCTTTHSKSVTQLGGNAPTISGSVSNNTAPMGTTPNGAIYISLSGGSAPFSFIWSNGATTEDITQLSAATYTVTVTGSPGCSRANNFTVTGSFLTGPGNPGELDNQSNETETDGVSGTIDAGSNHKVEVFPNPAAESFRVVIPETMGLVSVDIFDASTRLIKRFEERSLLEVQCGEWPSGNYTVRIMSLEHPELEVVSVNIVVNGDK